MSQDSSQRNLKENLLLQKILRAVTRRQESKDDAARDERLHDLENQIDHLKS